MFHNTKKTKFLFLIFFTFFVSLAFGTTKSSILKDQMLLEMDFIKYLFEVKYAPMEWKKTHLNFDLGQEIETAKAKIQSLDQPTVKDFQLILREFLHTTRDYHVKGVFFSTEFAYFPVSIRESEGRYFIVDIDRRFLTELEFPAQIGDEVISCNKKPIAEVIEELKKNELSPGREDADQAAIELLFSMRSGKAGNIVPKGKVTLRVLSKKTKNERDYDLKWLYIPEKITDVSKIPTSKTETSIPCEVIDIEKDSQTNLRFLSQKLFNKLMINSSFVKDDAYHSFFRKNCHTPGVKKSFIPPLGKIMWKNNADATFDAYVFEGPNEKLIGYVRIPHYMGDAAEAEEFAEIITLFKQHTDALVVDQINNPGGSLFYVYALASMLTDFPMLTPKHRIAITQEEVELALTILPELEPIKNNIGARQALGNTIGGYPVSYETVQLFRQFCRFVIDEWNAGHTITGPTHIFGVDIIKPNPKIHYTKPILLLINTLDYSGGDFFPAIFQDNKRATTLGTPTSGAGGYILGISHPNLMGISEIVLTASIAERKDHTPIENLGVIPDVYYKLSARDYQENYSGYTQAILENLKVLLEGNK